MKPDNSSDNGNESEGEEELISTWKVTETGVQVVNGTGEPLKVIAVGRNAGMGPLMNSIVQPVASQASVVATQPVVSLAKPQHQLPVMIATQQPQATKLQASWYIGGNHAVKLLTSVDGDFDPQALSALATVPAVIGELALSVESLVSDDLTVGGFEDELLAKIAANTLIGRQSSLTLPTAPVQVVPVAPQVSSPPQSPRATTVPNPLASYDPVPNPLARITPPTSPFYINGSFDTSPSNKRKDAPSSSLGPSTKAAKCEHAAPMIKAS